MTANKPNYMLQYQHWLDSPSLDKAEWRELSEISKDEKEIESRFFAPLEFGTGGLRGVLGLGINRMNMHVVRHATQAFAGVIVAEGLKAMEKGVVICYDCRDFSELFAKEAAGVMAGNGIKVRLFDAMRPTPELSFAIRHYEATAGINITASHNPREYNGYKVYWSDGAQLPPEHAGAIASAMAKIDIFTGIVKMNFEQAVESGIISYIGQETDETFLERVLGESIDRNVVSRNADKLKIVYTPFHGTGYKLVPEILKRLGITQLVPVPEQMIADGAFPTVKSPNPENPEGFALAVSLAGEVGSDLIIGTDPDADRVGVMVRGGDGEFIPISGNQMGVLLLDYIINARRRKGTLPTNAAAVKTIVTTEMAREICEKNNVHIEDTFTGFKFIAEKLAEYSKSGEYEYIMAYEESYGYMVGDYVRDKDGITTSMLVAEMAAYYIERGMNLSQAMDELYAKYGYFAEKTLNLVMPGVDGIAKMQEIMSSLRRDLPEKISGIRVIRQRDYQSGRVSVSGIGVVGSTGIHGSNVLYFEMNDGTSLIIRPSGTEPKIKIYILTRGENREECEEKIARYEEYARTFA